MIDTGTWYTGAVDVYNNNTAATSYSSARESSVLGKVGLISVYEYQYAASNVLPEHHAPGVTSTCWEQSGGYYDEGCYQVDWVYGLAANSNNYVWTINPYYNSNDKVDCIGGGAGYGMMMGGTGISGDEYILSYTES